MTEGKKRCEQHLVQLYNGIGTVHRALHISTSNYVKNCITKLVLYTAVYITVRQEL
jgi:hypothetical protein